MDQQIIDNAIKAITNPEEYYPRLPSYNIQQLNIIAHFPKNGVILVDFLFDDKLVYSYQAEDYLGELERLRLYIEAITQGIYCPFLNMEDEYFNFIINILLHGLNQIIF